jgi:hypothetical protein
MAIKTIYSKREKMLRREHADVYVYDEIPKALKVQIVYIWRETLGDGSNSETAYKYVVTTLRTEYGVFELSSFKGVHSYRREVLNFFLEATEVEQLLDVIELTFGWIDAVTRKDKALYRPSIKANEAIRELNQRFKEHGVGYQYIDKTIIRVDSELIHSEVVKPALRLLNQKHYAGAEQEFLKAYEHYRQNRPKEAMNECLKALESLMKSICDKRKWKYDASATAKNLIGICMDKGLIPAFWQSQFSSLRALLETGVPTGRNKLSAHGQGTSTTSVPDYLVAYMLHMTAAAIVCLAEAESNMP